MQGLEPGNRAPRPSHASAIQEIQVTSAPERRRHPLSRGHISYAGWRRVSGAAVAEIDRPPLSVGGVNENLCATSKVGHRPNLSATNRGQFPGRSKVKWGNLWGNRARKMKNIK